MKELKYLVQGRIGNRVFGTLIMWPLKAKLTFNIFLSLSCSILDMHVFQVIKICIILLEDAVFMQLYLCFKELFP